MFDNLTKSDNQKDGRGDRVPQAGGTKGGLRAVKEARAQGDLSEILNTRLPSRIKTATKAASAIWRR